MGRRAPAGRAEAGPLGLSVLVAVLPKCGVCVVAHATVLSALGVAAVPVQGWLRPVSALSLVAALALLAYRAPRRRGYRPFGLGCVAALLLLAELTHTHPAAAATHAGHLAHDAPSDIHGPLLTWAGVALLMAASLWNAWPAARKAACAAPIQAEGCGHAC